MLTLAFRFALVVPLLLFWLKPPPLERWKPFALMLLFVGPLHFGIQYVGLTLADDLAPMVVAMQLWAPASVVFAALVLKEHVSRLRWAGVAVAFLGVAAMTFDPAVFAQGWPLVMVAVAAACYGLGTVLVRRIGGGRGRLVDASLDRARHGADHAARLGCCSSAVRSRPRAVRSWIVWACDRVRRRSCPRSSPTPSCSAWCRNTKSRAPRPTC